MSNIVEFYYNNKLYGRFVAPSHNYTDQDYWHVFQYYKGVVRNINKASKESYIIYTEPVLPWNYAGSPEKCGNRKIVS